MSVRKSISPQNRQLIVYYYQLQYEVDGFGGGMTFRYVLANTLCQIMLDAMAVRLLDIINVFFKLIIELT